MANGRTHTHTCADIRTHNRAKRSHALISSTYHILNNVFLALFHRDQKAIIVRDCTFSSVFMLVLLLPLRTQSNKNEKTIKIAERSVALCHTWLFSMDGTCLLHESHEIKSKSCQLALHLMHTQLILSTVSANTLPKDPVKNNSTYLDRLTFYWEDLLLLIDHWLAI